MWENFDRVNDRISHYTCVLDKKFKTPRGLPAQETNLEQKLRQYWADKSVPNAKKLEGFEYDLSTFDPRNTTNKEMTKIRAALENMGVIDRSTGCSLDGVDVEYDRFGHEIKTDKRVDLFAYFDRNLKIYESEIAAGRTFLTETRTALYTAISVVMALQERGKASRSASLINTKV
jgi:hypothetical protein